MSQNAKLQEMMTFELSELMVSFDANDPAQVSDLFEVRNEGKVFGFTDAQSLREFLIIHDEQAQSIEVRKAGEEQWCAFYEHPQIQRRKPQLVQKQALQEMSEEQFWVLKEGQKTGPYAAQELKDLVESCDLLTTDLVSNDHGSSWMRLFEYEEFDRRNLQHHELPSTPQGKVFAESLRETRIALARSDKEREEAEAIAGLAYIGNLRSGKGVEVERKKWRKETTAQSDVQEEAEELSKESAPHQLAWYALFFLSLTGTIILLLTWNQGAPEQTAQQKSQQAATTKAATSNAQVPQQKAQVLEPISRTPSQAPRAQQGNRQVIEAPQAAPRAQQNSFRNSAAFQRAQSAPRISGERQMQDDPYVDDYFYDDGSSTFESDPVRSRLSRELTEPTLDDSWVEEMSDPEMYDTAIEESPFQDLFEADPY